MSGEKEGNEKVTEGTAPALSDRDPSRTESGSFTDEKVAPTTVSESDLELIHGDLKQLDVGLKLVAGHSDEPEVSPQESKRLRRKIDRHLLPLLCAIYAGESSFFATRYSVWMG